MNTINTTSCAIDCTYPTCTLSFPRNHKINWEKVDSKILRFYWDVPLKPNEVKPINSIMLILEKDPEICDHSLERISKLCSGKYSEPERAWFAPSKFGEAIFDNSTFALVSSCIKDDPKQSFVELVLRVAACKSASICEAVSMMSTMRKTFGLCYYNDKHQLIRWKL